MASSSLGAIPDQEHSGDEFQYSDLIAKRFSTRDEQIMIPGKLKVLFPDLSARRESA
jgi:hypothetical protein